MIKAPRRALLASAIALPFIQRGHAQAPWPDRPVRIIIPFGAGGPIDLVGRLLAEHLKERLGQPFIIENRPGAGGSIGIHTVVQSPPDGTAFVLTSASLASVPALTRIEGWTHVRPWPPSVWLRIFQPPWWCARHRPIKACRKYWLPPVLSRGV